MKTTHRVGLLISCGLLLAAGCGKKGDPVVPVIPKPQPVSEVKAHVDNRGVTLSWKIPTEYDTKAPLTLDDVRSFTIYRKTDMPVANGCIGLYNEHIEEVFDRTPVGTQVKVI